jgi:hypothetical protein
MHLSLIIFALASRRGPVRSGILSKQSLRKGRGCRVAAWATSDDLGPLPAPIPFGAARALWHPPRLAPLPAVSTKLTFPTTAGRSSSATVCCASFPGHWYFSSSSTPPAPHPSPSPLKQPKSRDACALSHSLKRRPPRRQRSRKRFAERSQGCAAPSQNSSLQSFQFAGDLLTSLIRHETTLRRMVYDTAYIPVWRIPQHASKLIRGESEVRLIAVQSPDQVPKADGGYILMLPSSNKRAEVLDITERSP